MTEWWAHGATSGRPGASPADGSLRLLRRRCGSPTPPPAPLGPRARLSSPALAPSPTRLIPCLLARSRAPLVAWPYLRLRPLPLSRSPLPVIVNAHGSGFALLSAASTPLDGMCRRLCRELGAVVVSVNYRLAPEHRYPAACDDGVDVLRYLSTTGLPDGLGVPVDLSRCFLVGDSAGGNIAHHVAQKWTSSPAAPKPIQLAGIILLQPFFGGEERTEASREAAERAGGEGVGGELALEAPEAAVREEEAVAEEVGEGDSEARALDVVGEAGAQEVVDDLRVGGADAVAEAEDAADLDGGGRGGGEEVGSPVEEAVQVAEERHDVAEDGVWIGAMVVGCRVCRGWAASEVEEQKDGKEED